MICCLYPLAVFTHLITACDASLFPAQYYKPSVPGTTPSRAINPSERDDFLQVDYSEYALPHPASRTQLTQRDMSCWSAVRWGRPQLSGAMRKRSTTHLGDCWGDCQVNASSIPPASPASHIERVKCALSPATLTGWSASTRARVALSELGLVSPDQLKYEVSDPFPPRFPGSGPAAVRWASGP